MSTLSFACKITPDNVEVPLGIEIWIGSKCILNVDHVKDVINFSYEFDDTEGQHTLQWILKNKLPSHTVLDQSGNIVSDAVLSIDHIMFDDIDCTKIVSNLATYSHNHNGSNENTTFKFYGDIGCNGIVELKFTTPVYLWLLENM